MDLLELEWLIFQICSDIEYYFAIVRLLKLERYYL